MKQFLFIKTATDSVAIPASALLRTEYTSDTTVSLFFGTTKDGKGATTAVVLSVTSGKANEVVQSIVTQAVVSKQSILKYDDVTDEFFTTNVTGISSITTTADPSSTAGPTGPTGPAGADGAGVPAGGSQFQLLRKVSGTDYDVEWDYADRVTLEVRFDEAVSKGDPLYITGFSQGQNRITVARADASDSSKMPSIGLAFADYSQNDNGQATSMGSLDDVDTSSFSIGNVLYVAATGGLTNTKPTGSNLIQNVGKVGRSNAINGQIVVMAIGRSNDLPNLSEGKYWVGGVNNVPEESSKLTQVYSQGFLDDIGTGIHYLPFKDINEQTTVYQEEAAFLMPFDGKIKSVSIKSSQVTQAGDFTVGVSTIPTGSNIFSGGNWTQQESEVVAYTSSSSNHTFHFVFSDAKHFDAGDSCSISLQASVDPGTTAYFYVTTIIEFDTTNGLGSSSTEHATNP